MERIKSCFKNCWKSLKSSAILCVFLFLLFTAIILFGDYIEANSDTLMVVITTVYVVATFEICRANINAAEASREQLAESKRQFDETRRLQVAPRLLLHRCSDAQTVDSEFRFLLLPDSNADQCRFSYFYLSVENAGMGAATEFSLKSSELSLSEGCKEIFNSVVYPKDNYKFLVTIGATQQGICGRKSVQETIELCYKDILGNTYVQKITLDLFIDEEFYVRMKEIHVSKAEIVKEQINHA